MNLLEMIGIAVRDGVYEVFMEYAKVTELKELKEAGFSVSEFPLDTNPASVDKLYVLLKENKIQLGCSLTIEKVIAIDPYAHPEPVVRQFSALETFELIKRISLAGKASLSAGESNNQIH